MMLAPWADAFVPIFGLLALGAILKRRLLPEDAIWAGIERLIYWVLLPCLIAGALSAVRFLEVPILGMAAALWTALAVGSLLAVLLARLLGEGHAGMTSVVQGGIRFNNLMGFAIGGAIWGAEGFAYAAVGVGLIVPFVQVVVTLAFAAGQDRALRPIPLLRQVLLNPLLLGCVVGYVLGWLGGLPPGLRPAVQSLGQASVALGLLCVGAALTPAGFGMKLPAQAMTAVLKLVVMPAMTWALCAAIGLGPLPTAMTVLFMALPTAATSYVMARAMGGDAPLMAAITTSEHLLSMATLPVWVWLLTR